MSKLFPILKLGTRPQSLRILGTSDAHAELLPPSWSQSVPSNAQWHSCGGKARADGCPGVKLERCFLSFWQRTQNSKYTIVEKLFYRFAVKYLEFRLIAKYGFNLEGAGYGMEPLRAKVRPGGGNGEAWASLQVLLTL